MKRRRRLRVRRSMLTVLMLVLLAMLLELNYFLPGAWPGGSDGGFRRWSVHTSSEDRLRPPEEDLPPLEPDAITVVLRGGGSDLDVAVDAPGSRPTRPDANGHARLGGDRLLASGFVIRTRSAALRHGSADPAVARTWTVHLPDALLESAPDAAGEPRPLEIQVLAREDGRPLAGVTVRARTPDALLQRTTDDEGRVTLEAMRGRARITVEAEGRGTAEQWIHPIETTKLELKLHRVPRIDSRILASHGLAATVTKLRVVSPDGRVMWEANPTLESLPLEVGTGGEVEDARLEIWTPDHAVVRLPLAELPPEIRLPQGRTFRIYAVDKKSHRVPGVRVTVHYVPEDLGGTGTGSTLEPIEVAVSGGNTVVLPTGRRARLLVEALGSAPAMIEIGADEAPGTRKVRLGVGRSLTVTVRDVNGEPVAAARVIALASADTTTVRRTGTTLPDGTARLNELPPGPVEVYAKARGSAWAAAVSETSQLKEAIELQVQPGRTLRLVVESPLGLPLGGVRVHAEPQGPGPLDVVPPDARLWRTNREGTLVLDDLRDREYRVRLSLPGYEDAEIHAVRPGTSIHFVTLMPVR